MSKSTGHVVDLVEALDTYPPVAVRLFYLRTHYRKPLDFNEEAMDDAIASLDRIRAFGRRCSTLAPCAPDPMTMAAFTEAMDDDFDAAGGLAVAFEAVREGNRRLDTGGDASALASAVAEIVQVLGLDAEADSLDDLAGDIERIAGEFGITADSPAGVVDALVALRTSSRESRDWATADAVRDQLAAVGITVEDGADGSRWHRG